MDVFESFRLNGKVAIVTGAGKGIGAAIAVTLAQGARMSRSPLARRVTSRAWPTRFAPQGNARSCIRPTS